MPVKRIKRVVKKRDVLVSVRKKFCRLCVDKVKALDYKDARRLEAFIKERAKIVSRRFSGNCARHQRMVAEAIKKARFISLLPYTRV
ncbi:MAG: 30S ribosomal protein S18 [Candidatus Omnitrophota bacterium]